MSSDLRKTTDTLQKTNSVGCNNLLGMSVCLAFQNLRFQYHFFWNHRSQIDFTKFQCFYNPHKFVIL